MHQAFISQWRASIELIVTSSFITESNRRIVKDCLIDTRKQESTANMMALLVFIKLIVLEINVKPVVDDHRSSTTGLTLNSNTISIKEFLVVSASVSHLLPLSTYLFAWIHMS
jgi:hypothetical protein